MGLLVRASVLLLLLSSPFAGQTGNWKKYTNTEGSFSVLFPGEPQDSVNQKDDKIDSHTVMSVEKPVFYTMVYTNMADEQTVDDANFKTFRDAVFKELSKCQVDAEQAASPAMDGYIGHAYRLSCTMPNVRLAMTGPGRLRQHSPYKSQEQRKDLN